MLISMKSVGKDGKLPIRLAVWQWIKFQWTATRKVANSDRKHRNW